MRNLKFANEFNDDETRNLTRFERIAFEELIQRFGAEKGFCEKPDISIMEKVKDDEFPDQIE